jgi:hypothetical protein
LAVGANPPQNSNWCGRRILIVRRASVAIVILYGFIGNASLACAQSTSAPETTSGAPAIHATTDFKVLEGRWVRPDGGYTISIKGADSDGNLDATYFNPATLPFSKAKVTAAGNVLNVFFELQSGGYAGSTYALRYDPAGDRLAGIYFQAVAQQKFEVIFVRQK